MKNYLLILFTALFFASANAQVLFFEDFETTVDTLLPDNWNQSTRSTDGGFRSGTVASLSSPAWPLPARSGRFLLTNDDGCRCDKGNDLVWTRSINLEESGPYVFFSADFLYLDYSASGVIEDASVEVSTDSGATWTKIYTINGSNPNWRTVYLNFSAYAGNPNVMIGFRYTDGGGWMFGLGIDNVKLYVPPASDVSLREIVIPDYIAVSPQYLTGTFFNEGRDTIRSITAVYSINDGPPEEQVINNLMVYPLMSKTFAHPTVFLPETYGVHNVKFWVKNPNSVPEEDETNNVLEAPLKVASKTVQRLPLVEEFSSSTCLPCAQYNSTFIPLMLNTYRANMSDATVALVKYQMNWPAPGNDPAYNSESNSRKQYYGVTSLPTVIMDGAEFNGDVTVKVADRRNKIAAVDIKLRTIWRNDSLVTTATVYPYIALNAGTKLFIGYTEDEYSYTQGPTSEKVYRFVFRKMISGTSGISLPAMSENDSITFTRSWKPKFGSVNQGNTNFWDEDLDEITTIAWVQDPVNDHVFQAKIYDQVDDITGIRDEEAFEQINVFPNPATNDLYLRFSVKSPAPVKVSLSNLIGQTVLTQDAGMANADNNFIHLSLNGLPKGMYILKTEVGSSSFTRKVIVK